MVHSREYVEERLFAFDASDAVLIVVLIVVLSPGDFPLGQVVNAARLRRAVALERAVTFGQRGVSGHEVAILPLSGTVELNGLLQNSSIDNVNYLVETENSDKKIIQSGKVFLSLAFGPRRSSSPASMSLVVS